MREDAVVVVKGDSKNLKGFVEYVEGDIVHIRPTPTEKIPLKTVAVQGKELAKYFEPGCQVKITVFSAQVFESNETSESRTKFGINDYKERPQNSSASKSLPQHSSCKSLSGSRSSSTMGQVTGNTWKKHDSFIRRNKISNPRFGIPGYATGPYKGYRGYVKGVNGQNVKVELEAQMKLNESIYLTKCLFQTPATICRYSGQEEKHLCILVHLCILWEERHHGELPSVVHTHIPRLWAPPQKGFHKLNTDGSWISVDNAGGGGGGVIRCDKGIWVAGFASKFNALSAATAELLAIRDGLLLAWDKRIRFLELETDADSLSKMLKDPKSFEDGDLGNIIRDVASLLQRDWEVIVFHANKCVNFVDDRLATMGRTKYKTGDNVPFSYPPPEVYQTYALEVQEMQNP
uniref:RNase H type-1 domain-containing protein n=1 Tax=Chenopodium quinoa TaxID=63459 RepID=A0A803LHF6_CHEQI